MSELASAPFLHLLTEAEARGGLETDDVLAVILPLMEQVAAVHLEGKVAPLRGVQDLLVNAEGALAFAPEKTRAAEYNSAKISELQMPMSRAVEVLADMRRTTDISAASVKVSSLQIGQNGEPVTKLVYLPDYQSWEHAIGHHDELTDIFSLGQLLASLACGLNFTEVGDLELFVGNRENLFGVHNRLNPVVASVIVQMTALNRHKRAPDLGEMISRLKHYRDQPASLDISRIEGLKESGLGGKRRLIQTRLRERLFEISRRNRLIYFKPTLQTLNLTVASVPLVVDFRNIKLEQLFVWHVELAGLVKENLPIPLGKYLRFEDAPYIPGVLDKIISEERRDRAEFGFAQLRLVLCFLHWNNLKETPEERIHSPLLLLPVDLVKKKGVRDNYVLEAKTSEVEVNPMLRHHLRELYNLHLPEFIDLHETTLDQFYESLKAQIQASEPGVTLNKIDRPQIDLIHERARQRVDQYRRRMKLKARQTRSTAKPDYSYNRENFRPLGLQLFLKKVRPTPLPLRGAVGAAPAPRLPHMVDPAPAEEAGKVMETERQMFALRKGTDQNPYSWDFDLCSITLGNFNYRKMTLVRDYTHLIDTNLATTAFDAVFSLNPKPAEEPPLSPLNLAEQHLIIPCDATQASAIARARAGGSYIIQGPPGTGKSQTITNLIADYVARGKRVLFVCEKRAAIDVVFHRLRQVGLDELCCLIHDSQTDKKGFIQNLKQTYEMFLSQADFQATTGKSATSLWQAMAQDAAALQRFSDAMSQTHPSTGLTLRALLHRLVELRGRARELALEIEDILPEYPLWQEHGEIVNRLRAALEDLGEDLCFAKSPLRWLGKDVLTAARPLEMLTAGLTRAEDLIDTLQSALDLSGLPSELWQTFADIQAILEFAVAAQPLAERNMLGALSTGKAAQQFNALARELDAKAQALQNAKQKTKAWKDPLSPDDTQNALAQAKAFENSFFRFLQPAFWRLKKTLQARYDFAQSAVIPAWSRILQELAAQHEAQAALAALRQQAGQDWQTDDLDKLRNQVAVLRGNLPAATMPVKTLVREYSASEEAKTVFENLSGLQPKLGELDATLRTLLTDHGRFDFATIQQMLGELREQTSVLVELLPILSELVEIPEAFNHALRQVDVPLNEFEAAIGHKSVNVVYRQDRSVSRFEGRTLMRKMEQLDKHYREWLVQNARSIRADVRKKFLEHVNLSTLTAAQLNPEQKVFKKTYATGRRELEHEFGKTMRFKSIRDLAAGDTGHVIQDLKPIWLMSPLSVSDTLPLDPNYFDVVVFDEASQIPLEEAIPAIYRAQQIIVVGDEMQLPPTSFFSSSRATEEDDMVVEEAGERIKVILDSDSLLTQSASNLPSTLLAWHYRSRYESLISFSNAAFYSGNLFTIPDRQRAQENLPEIKVTDPMQGGANVEALLARSTSFHFMTKSVYEDRRNPAEAAYIAQLVRGLLLRQTGMSIGIVAFSEAQQTEIEEALARLAEEDSEFSARFEAESVREEHDQFCGLFVKNLENVQGDERDIIIMSVCYGRDANGRILMNFGPINQRGGEKRLNVIFSRAKQHMALVSSIRHPDITNDYNDGANCLKNFLNYAEASSKGDTAQARRVLENLNPLSRKSLAPVTQEDVVVETLAKALRERGHEVDINVGQSKFRCNLAVRGENDRLYKLGILVDTDGHYANANLLDRYLMQPAILRAFGWRFAFVLTKDWYHNPDDVLARLERMLQGEEIGEEPGLPEDEPAPEPREESEASQPAVEAEAAGPKPPPVDVSNVVAPPIQLPTAGGVSPGRRFEFISETSRKFWEISVSDKSLAVRFGRIGTAGQVQSKSFADAARAQREAAALVAEKLKKGYREVGGQK